LDLLTKTMRISPENVGIIIGSVTTIIGTLLGASITYLCAIRLHKYTLKKSADIALRSSFAEELYSLKEEETLDPCEFLERAFKKHSLAIAEFTTHLSKTEIVAFENAWITYYGVEKKSLGAAENNCDDLPANWKKHPFFEKYKSNTCGRDKAKERRKLAQTNIENILKFTE